MIVRKYATMVMNPPLSVLTVRSFSTLGKMSNFLRFRLMDLLPYLVSGLDTSLEKDAEE